MAKTKTLEDLYPIVEELTTVHQIMLRDFLQKTLDEKATKAADELGLINGGTIIQPRVTPISST